VKGREEEKIYWKYSQKKCNIHKEKDRHLYLNRQ